MEQVAASAQAAGPLVHSIPRYLGHPCFGRMPGDPAQGHAPTFQMQEEQHVIDGQPSPGQYHNCEEIRSDQDRQMRRDEFAPGCVLAALGGRCEAMALQHVA